jgi:hypothetical protein
MGVVHDFQRSLFESHACSDLSIWEQIYRQSFPDFLCMVDHRQDGEHQRAGIDRSVILQNSKQLLIDEKIRKKAYDDVALEYISNTTKDAPGWVCKPLRADYIAYAIAPKGICYLLPVVQLQAAWKRCGAQWIESHREVRAANRGYDTLSVAVPVNELFSEIGRALRVPFAALELA